jgi:DNA-binding NarL/FixJ family response regulator
MSERIDIILVDDHRLFREGLARLLASDARFRVVAQAASGEEFLEAVETRATETNRRRHAASERSGIDLGNTAAASDGEVQGDVSVATSAAPVVFMDIDMPGMGGAEASRRALERWPEMKIVALSMHGEQEFYLPMIEAGVKGFLFKNSEFGEVTAAAEAVAAGGTYFSQELMSSIVAAMAGAMAGDGGHGGSRNGEPADEEPFDACEPLSEREAEVLPLVCEGYSNRQIADRLFISKRTVDKHRANIMAKTGCKNTAGLVVYAVKRHLIEV